MGEALVNEGMSSLERPKWFTQHEEAIIFSLKPHLL